MKTPTRFCLLNQDDRSRIAPGDRIDILEAYSRNNHDVAFVHCCRINDRRMENLLPRVYRHNLEKLHEVNGVVTVLKSCREDLIIDVEQTSRRRPPTCREPLND